MVIPISLATKDTRIVLAGDHMQVSGAIIMFSYEYIFLQLNFEWY